MDRQLGRYLRTQIDDSNTMWKRENIELANVKFFELKEKQEHEQMCHEILEKSNYEKKKTE